MGYWYDYHISKIQIYCFGFFFVQLLHAITEYNYFQPAAGVPAERSECKPRINLWAKQKNPRYMVIVPWAFFFVTRMKVEYFQQCRTDTSFWSQIFLKPFIRCQITTSFQSHIPYYRTVSGFLMKILAGPHTIVPLVGQDIS